MEFVFIVGQAINSDKRTGKRAYLLLRYCRNFVALESRKLDAILSWEDLLLSENSKTYFGNGSNNRDEKREQKQAQASIP